LCDVVLMYTTHLLLERSCQFDRKTKHDEFKNMYYIEKDVKTFTPVPLSPRQVYEDQLKLNGKRKNEEKK
jgi:hypothetical protein